MHLFTDYPSAVQSVKEAITTGDATLEEFDIPAILDKVIQYHPYARRYYVCPWEIGAVDGFDLEQKLDDDAYSIADAFWTIVEANCLLS